MAITVSNKPTRWGEPSKYSLTELEAYDVMLHFLKTYWERGGRGPRDIATLLSDTSRNIWAALGPGDPAQWGDWLAAVEAVKNRPQP